MSRPTSRTVKVQTTMLLDARTWAKFAWQLLTYRAQGDAIVVLLETGQVSQSGNLPMISDACAAWSARGSWPPQFILPALSHRSHMSIGSKPDFSPRAMASLSVFSCERRVALTRERVRGDGRGVSIKLLRYPQWLECMHTLPRRARV